MAKQLDGPYQLKYIRPHHSVTLARLFRFALDSDFTYYSPSYLEQTRRQNSAFRLALGCMRSSRLILGLWDDTELVGYIIGGTRPNQDCGDIFWLYIDPAHRGRGLGANLLTEAIHWLRLKKLSAVELVTYDHAEFYKRYDFKPERLAEGFIGGQDVYIMKRSLV